MDITPLITAGTQIIQRYGNGKFYISEKEYHEALLLLPHEVSRWGSEKDADYSILYEMIAARVESIEVILFGLGAEVTSLLPKEFLKKLKALGIAADVMNTGAACRTYNVLLSESRKVAAVLIPVD